jgi:hypothetical protein
MGCDMVGAPSAPPNSHWASSSRWARGRPCRQPLYLLPTIAGLLPFCRVHPSYSAPIHSLPLWPLYKVGLGHQTDQHWQSTRHRVSTSLISIVSPESENQFLIELKSE